MENREEKDAPVAVPALTKSAKKRLRQKRKKAEAQAVAALQPTPEDRQAAARKARLRQAIQRKHQQRSRGQEQEILVPAPVPGELANDDLQKYQKQMQKLVNHKGRQALLDHLGIHDKQTKIELAKAMVSKDTNVMNQIMKRVHDPTQDPDLDK